MTDIVDIAALKVTLTRDEIEHYAQRMAHVDFDTRRDGKALIGHLYGANVMAVLKRANDIRAENLALAEVDLETWRIFKRLMDAAGCPADAPVLPWLMERGLAGKVDGRWWFKKPGPSP